jgi:hypothetical protein
LLASYAKAFSGADGEFLKYKTGAEEAKAP